MTVLNVAGLLREAPGAVREVRLRDRYLSLGPDVELAGPLNGKLSFQRTNRGVLVRGEIEAAVRRTCAGVRYDPKQMRSLGIDYDGIGRKAMAAPAPDIA